MKKTVRIVSLILAVFIVMSFCSCGIYDTERGTLNFKLMSYTRPDMDAIKTQADEIVGEIKSDGEYQDKLDAVNSFNETFWNFYTMSTLATIKRSIDYSNESYAEESAFFDTALVEMSRIVSTIYDACADSSYKTNFETDYFGEAGLDGYGTSDGETYPQELADLFTRESEYETKYYELVSSRDYTEGMTEETTDEEYFAVYNAYLEEINAEAAEIYLKLVEIRKQISDFYGYESYIDYCYDTTAYTAQQAMEYRKNIAAYVVPLYKELTEKGCGEAYDRIGISNTDVLTSSGKLIKQMSPELYDIFTYMVKYSLCDVGYSENKLDTAYQTYIDWYNAPFIVMNSTGYDDDITTFIHEFGHFTDAYINYDGTYETEACEFSSQGLEILCMLYLDDIGLDKASAQAVKEDKLYDMAERQLTQCYISEFETRVYSENPKTLSAEKLNAISRECAAQYGIDGGAVDTSLEWVSIEHIFAYPLYTISYCISADAALQLYALEKAEAGRGLEVYLDGVNGNDENSYFDNLTRIGLKLPFEESGVKVYADTLRECFTED